MSFKCINIHSSSALRVLCLSSFPSLVLCLAAQSSPIVCDSTDCSPPGSSIHGDSPGKNTEVGCHFLLQGIFPTQGLSPGLPHCRWILYCLSDREAQQSFNFYPKKISFPKRCLQSLLLLDN